MKPLSTQEITQIRRLYHRAEKRGMWSATEIVQAVRAIPRLLAIIDALKQGERIEPPLQRSLFERMP